MTISLKQLDYRILQRFALIAIGALALSGLKPVFGFYGSGFLARIPLLPGFAPHLYNYLIWGLFVALVLFPRFKLYAIPIFFISYYPSELIFNVLYSLFYPKSIAFTFALPTWDMWFAGLSAITIFSFMIARNKFQLSKDLVGLSIFLIFLYLFVVSGLPLIGAYSQGVGAPLNLLNAPWEIGWQFAYLFFAYRQFISKKPAA